MHQRDPRTHDRSTWGQAPMLSAGHKRYQTADELYDKALALRPHAGPEERAEMRAHAAGSKAPSSKEESGRARHKASA